MKKEPTVRIQKVRRDTLKPRLILFGTLAVLLLVASIFSEQLCPYDPYLQDLSIAKMAPSAEHIFGTDRYGRDMLSRVIVGSKTSIFSTLLLVAIITVIGTIVGVFSAWIGGWTDTILMRISDLFLAFPGLVFALAVAGVLGGGLHNAIIALAAISWPKFARIARSQTLAQKEMPYFRAAKLAGGKSMKIIVKHVLPNIMGPILVTSMLDIGTMMMELAGLSFLGLGAKPPAAEWGSMISDTRGLLQTAPWLTFAPGLAIFVSVMIFNLSEGEILGIVGESGSGKSTLIKAAMGLLGPAGLVTRGDIWYQGKNLPDLKPAEIRKLCGPDFGMIFQSAGASFCPIRTVGAQLYESVREHEEMTKDEFVKRASEVFEKIGFQDPVRILKSFPFELSGGMQQRVGIASAMLLRPAILMADEPTSALDVHVQKQVVEEMMLLRKEYGVSIIIVTHNIGVVGAMADNVLVMQKGRAVEYGPTKKIIETPETEYTKTLMAAVPRLNRGGAANG